MKIEEIRHRIAQGKYLIKTHAIQHALKEGFERKNMLEAVEKGKVIENYPQEQRLLICGTTYLTEQIAIYLHIVCEYSEEYVEFVTAYIPDEYLWENPPFKRRR
jgi:hypothetical protein